MGPGVLSEILENLPNVHDPKLIVGFDTSDDACVYHLTDEIAAIHTVDFFTPIVDDPYWFGQIAAANSLSDVYAMGGRPAVAMNLLFVPNCLSLQTIRRILEGGHDKAVEAGCVIAGGHTIQDQEPKYGLCVTGFVHPDKVLANSSAQVGDVLILTKALGSGILNTAVKAELLEEDQKKDLIRTMTTLNAAPARVMEKYTVHACTDITGFGLGGHVLEMAEGCGHTIALDTNALPILPGTLDFARMGIIPAGAHRNRQQAEGKAWFAPTVPLEVSDVVFDPQTSGGLIISVAASEAKALQKELEDVCPDARIVGEVRPRSEYSLIGE